MRDDNSRLQAVALQSAPQHGSGFRSLPDSASAMQVRLALLELAERTIDLQYYAWNADSCGISLLAALLRAADRKVQVRLLLDGLNAASIKPYLQSISALPTVRIRLFNPITPGRVSRLARLVPRPFRSRCVRPRMHNKLFIADGAMAIVGSRDVGDEYLGRTVSSNLHMDVLCAGCVVADLADSFDRFWSSNHSVDAERAWNPARDGQLQARDAERAGAAALRASTLRKEVVLDSSPTRSVSGDLASGAVALDAGVARLFTTPGEESTRLTGDGTERPENRPLTQFISAAKHDLFIVSPNLVGGNTGIQWIESLARRGVRIALLTNSLANACTQLGHAAYQRYRPSLLQLGVQVRETVAVSEVRRGKGEAAAGRLRATLAVVDRQYVYLGSLDLTSRGEGGRTELRLLIDCPELARAVLQTFSEAPSYQVQFCRAGFGLQWIDREAGSDRVWDREPSASLGRRLMASLLDSFVSEDES